jgi:hypothetical protein
LGVLAHAHHPALLDAEPIAGAVLGNAQVDRRSHLRLGYSAGDVSVTRRPDAARISPG